MLLLIFTKKKKISLATICLNPPLGAKYTREAGTLCGNSAAVACKSCGQKHPGAQVLCSAETPSPRLHSAHVTLPCVCAGKGRWSQGQGRGALRMERTRVQKACPQEMWGLVGFCGYLPLSHLWNMTAMPSGGPGAFVRPHWQAAWPRSHSVPETNLVHAGSYTRPRVCTSPDAHRGSKCPWSPLQIRVWGQTASLPEFPGLGSQRSAARGWEVCSWFPETKVTLGRILLQPAGASALGTGD